MHKTAFAVAMVAGVLVAGCSSNTDEPAPIRPSSAQATNSPKPPPTRTVSPEESKAINSDTQYYAGSEKKIEIGAVVSLRCQVNGKTRADIGYPAGSASASGYDISRSVYPSNEDVVLGTFNDINKGGCNFGYLVSSKRVSPQGPALLVRPFSGHWKVETPQQSLAEGGFASYDVRVKPGATTYLLFEANGDTAASKPVTLFGYEQGRYTDLMESPEKLLK